MENRMCSVEEYKAMTPEQRAALDPQVRAALEDALLRLSAPQTPLTPNQDVVIPPNQPGATPQQPPVACAQQLTYAEQRALGIESGIGEYFKFWRVRWNPYDVRAMIAGGLILVGIIAGIAGIYAIFRKAQ